MAEPDWTLIQTTLQQLQADNAEFKASFQQVLADLAEIKEDVRQVKSTLRYAVGSAGVAEHNALQADLTSKEVRRELDALKARVEALETR